MNIQQYVNNILCVPVTRAGNRLIVESIEIVLDTHDSKFYGKLSEATGISTRRSEKLIRDAKNLGLSYMNPELQKRIFPTEQCPKNSTYILQASDYYRRNYENKEEG